MPHILDTNIFNRLVDGAIALADLPDGGHLVATHIQIDEINSTKDLERRARLFLAFAQARPEIVPTETFVWDVSRWDQGKWSDGVLYEKLKVRLDELNRSKANNPHDALIGEVAIINNFTLLTADRHLAQVVKELGGNVVLFEA